MKKIPDREQINTRAHWNDAHKMVYTYSGYDFYCNLLYRYIPFLKTHGYQDPLDEPGYWLDFGCGVAKRNSILDFPKNKYIGYDLSDYITELNRKNDPDNIYVDNLDELREKKISYITALHVFEHLSDPQEEFLKLWNLTTRFLSIQVPHKESYRSCVEHIWEFDEKSFQTPEGNEPITIIGPQMNLEGDREILYFWDKQKPQKSRVTFAPYEQDFSGQGWYLEYQRLGFIEYYNSVSLLLLSKMFGRTRLYRLRDFIAKFRK